jgi:hypothetical protein
MYATAYRENSIWLEWVSVLAAGPALVYNVPFDLLQAGPRDRQNYNAELIKCANEDPDNRDILIRGTDPNPEKPCWWDVQLFGWTLETTLGAGVPGVPTIQDPRVAGLRNVPLQGRVSYWGGDVDFDVGAGAHLSIFAAAVGLGVVAPLGTLRVVDPAIVNFTGAPAAPVNITDVLVYAFLTACVHPHGNQQAKLTQAFTIPAAITDINIPARARTLQVFQDTASLPAAPLNWIAGPISGFDLGEIDFQLIGAPGRTDILEVPDTASIVRVPAGARNLTFVWGLDL